MAEGIVEQSTEQIQEVSNGIPPELKQMMELSINGPSSFQPLENAAANENQVQQVADQQQQTTVTDAAPVITDNNIVDVFAPFKEKFGYQSPEDALKEIEELRALKENPPKFEFQAENEDSQKLYNAIVKGDKKEVYNILAKQEKLEQLTTVEVSKETAADIIKYGMSLKFKDLSPAEIDYKFNKDFGFPKEPKEPIQKADEDSDDFNDRKSKWEEDHANWREKIADIEMNRIIEAKTLRPELELAKSKIVLPDIEADVDEGYSQYLKMLEDKPRQHAEIAAAYKALTPQNIETRVKFTDEQSKVDFEFQYVPDSESFNQTVELVSDMDKLYKHFQNQDGTPDRKRFLEAMYFGINKEKILREALKQSKNATIKASLPDNSGGSQRQFPQQQQLSEVDKLMQLSLNGYQGRS